MPLEPLLQADPGLAGETAERPQADWAHPAIGWRPAVFVLVLLSCTAGAAWMARFTSTESRASMRSKTRQLTPLCNASVYPPVGYSQAFSLDADWNAACHGQGSHPVQAPPFHPKWNGQTNYCWTWMKHKGCKEVIASLNWADAQQKTAQMQLAPPPQTLPMQPVTNPQICQAYEHGATLPVGQIEQNAAMGWFNQNVAVYVLSLPSDTARWQAISSNLAQRGITPQLIPGVDLSQPGAFQQAQAQGKIPPTFNLEFAQRNAGTGLSGTAGTAAAHLGAQQHVISSGQQQPLAIILEDDVTLEQDFVVKLKQIVEHEAPCDWSAISLKSACPHGVCVTPHLTRVQPDVNEPLERCRHGVNYGFYGMLYQVGRLQDLHQRLAGTVWDANRPHCLDVDVALASISDQVAYYAVPFWQKPGLLQMGGHGSHRADMDKATVAVPAPAAPAAASPYPGYAPAPYAAR